MNSPQEVVPIRLLGQRRLTLKGVLPAKID